MQLLGELQDREQFQQLNWRGSFADYLELVASKPQVTRNAFQRIYDMIMSYGTEEFIDAKKRLIRYKFFPMSPSTATTPSSASRFPSCAW